MLMICKFGNGFVSANFPNDSLSIPWTRYKMIIIDEIDGGYCAIVLEKWYRGTVLVKAVDFSISGSYHDQDQPSLPIYLQREDVFLENIGGCDLLQFSIFDIEHMEEFVAASSG